MPKRLSAVVDLRIQTQLEISGPHPRIYNRQRARDPGRLVSDRRSKRNASPAQRAVEGSVTPARQCIATPNDYDKLTRSRRKHRGILSGPRSISPDLSA